VCAKEPHTSNIYVYIYLIYTYGVATISRMLKNIGLFCKKDLQKRPIFCKETYIFKHPTHRSHPISNKYNTCMSKIYNETIFEGWWMSKDFDDKSKTVQFFCKTDLDYRKTARYPKYTTKLYSRARKCCVASNDKKNLYVYKKALFSRKKPYMSAKEPYMSEKELCIHRRWHSRANEHRVAVYIYLKYTTRFYPRAIEVA